MKKIIIPMGMLLITHSVFAQLTPTENYIQSKTYLEAVTTSSDNARQIETVQYFDGLGRPKQVVNVKASPLGRDVATKIEYDGFGRQTRDYLPVPQSGTQNGAIIPDPLANAANTPYGSEKIYSDKILESSPLSRIQQQIQVGNDWAAKPVKFQYEANTIGEVKKFVTITSWVNGATQSSLVPATDPDSENGNYKAGQLYKNVAIDEDENKTIEFKNGKGQTILVRKVLSATENADTYYIYNEYDQLTFVISPKGLEIINGLKSGTAIPATVLDEMCYQYHYDGRNRLVEKKLPGKGWEYMVYDKTDRLILTQDANLKGQNKWIITKYDQLGRVAYTGFLTTGGERSGRQNEINNLVIAEERSTTGFTRNGMTVYYTDTYFVGEIQTILSVNYYDTYPQGSPAANNQFSEELLTDNLSQPRNTKGLPLASYVKNIEDDNWTKTFTWYDTRGRAIETHSINHLGGYTRTESKLYFAGVPKTVVTKHKRLNADTERVITENFEYDNQNRLLVHKHQVDSNPVEILTQNKYNELSQLESKKVGGINAALPLQQVDYRYNIRGWTTQINDPASLGTDLFGYKINYNKVEGQETPNNDFTNLKVKPRYNGNIAEVSWKTLTEYNEPLKTYGYVYDPLNRLSAGFYQKAGNELGKEYFERLEYDLNGNITRLQRSAGMLVGSNTAIAIDNLKYDYTGNKLIRVTDEQMNPSGYPYIASPGTIGYDNGNGNMTSHPDKGISSIQYNYLNLPEQITQNSNVTNYTYRADGVKVKKLFGDVETNYLNGFQYKSVRPSEEGGLFDPNEVAVMKLMFIPTAEGYYDAIGKQYVYNFTDHLGNVRLSYTDTNKDGTIQPRKYFWQECDGPYKPPFQIPNCIDGWKPGEIVEVNNYYPFGQLHNYTMTTQNAYQYKYNGKELQETGMYDYGARFYMPDLGRWGVMDPLAEIYRKYSPYNYTVNNPIRFTDPDGRTINDPKSKEEAKHTTTGLNMRKTYLQTQRNLIIRSATDKNGKVSLSRSQKKEMANINSMVNQVNKSLNDITDMVNDKNNDYVFRDALLNGGLPETKRTGSTEITIYFDGFATKVHEGRHGGQMARKEYDANSSGNLISGSFGASKEVDAYRAQLSAVGQILYQPYLDFSNPSNALKIGKTQTVTELNEINNSFLQSLVDKPGLNQTLIYPPSTNKSYYAQ